MAEFNLEEVLSKITNNPEIMSKVSEIAKANKDGEISDALPQVMEAIMPSVKAEDSENKDERKDTDEPKSHSGVISPLQVPLEKMCQKINKNSKLLTALKPYLSKERCEIIDNIIKMAQVANLLSLTK